MQSYADGGGTGGGANIDPPVFGIGSGGAGKRNYPHAKRIFGNLQQQISSACGASSASIFTTHNQNSNSSSSTSNNSSNSQIFNNKIM